MNETKENLINSLVIQLADNTNLSIGELKAKLQTELYNWNVTKIESTELSVANGDVTRELLRFFEIGKLGSNKSKETIVQYERVVIQLCDLVGKELNMITAEDVNYFLVKYKEIHGVSDTTMESKRLYLSSVFTYLHKNRKIAENPLATIDPISCTTKVQTPISEEELEKIVMSCQNQRRKISTVYFLISTGVRVSELCNLKLKDVNFEKCRALVLGKRRKERYVYFDSRTKIRLLDYIVNDRPDITFVNGQMHFDRDTPLIASLINGYHPIQKNAIESDIRDIGAACGVDRIHPHLFRSTYATNLLRKGVDIHVIAKLMGHSKIETTARYILLSNTEIEHIISNCH